jgi:hypothetical protein
LSFPPRVFSTARARKVFASLSMVSELPHKYQ